MHQFWLLNVKFPVSSSNYGKKELFKCIKVNTTFKHIRPSVCNFAVCESYQRVNEFLNKRSISLFYLGSHASIDMFHSMPDTSLSKTDPLPSTDLFSAGTLLHLVCNLACTFLFSQYLVLCLLSALSLALIREQKKQVMLLSYRSATTY